MTAEVIQSVTSVDELARTVSDANSSRIKLRIVSAGGWRDAGRPVSANQTLDCSRLRGIVEYTPGDLTLTARAGTTLAELDDATRSHGQWITLDPPGPRTGTLGATMATASAGPLAATIGAPRDCALGLTFVNGEGDVIQGGGRVVKNVAGFDLVRLSIGAWGTLGVLAEVTLRLRAIPAVDSTFRMSLPGDERALTQLLSSVRDCEVQPLAAQLVNAAVAHLLGVGPGPALLLRLAGNRTNVLAQRQAMHRVAPVEEVPGTVWSALSLAEPTANRLTRLATTPVRLAPLWHQLASQFGDGPFMHARLWSAVVRVSSPPEHDETLRDLLSRSPSGASMIAERIPMPMWNCLAPSSRSTSTLAQRIRRAFDPNGILNPGILGPELA